MKTIYLIVMKVSMKSIQALQAAGYNVVVVIKDRK